MSTPTRLVFAALGTAFALAATAEEIDITKAVRDAGKGTTVLENGTLVSGYSIDNAFGDLNTFESRVMLTNAYNRINWTIADDFEAGKSIIVTGYTIRRAFYKGSAGDGNDYYSRRRAPIAFYLQGSYDGLNWITLDEQNNVSWVEDGEMEKTFAVDPRALASYRKYRFVPWASMAEKSDTVHCSFQYVKLTGTIGDNEPLTRTCRKLDHLVAREGADTATRLEDITLNFDSRIELDLSLFSASGTQAIFASGRAGSNDKIRLFHTAEDGWWYQYGTAEKKTGIKAYPGARYKIVADGPVLTINGIEVANLGAKKTGAAGSFLTLFGSLAASGLDLYNLARGAKVWSVKVYDADGTLAHDLQPVQYHNGGARFLDAKTLNMYASDTIYGRYRKDYVAHKWLASVMPPMSNVTVRLVQGEASGGDYTVSNAFTSAVSLKDRALFKQKKNVIQYDIHDDYRPGWPVVVARYVIYPCLAKQDEGHYAYKRAPSQFELQASKTGADDGEWVTLSKITVGLGPGAYNQGWELVGKSIDDKTTDLYGHIAQTFDVPEANRGDYRHYRFITLDSSAEGYDSVKMGFQNIEFQGFRGGFESACEPVEYVQNGHEQQTGNNTYFKTGVTPQACDLTIEMTGAFTDVNQTSCLFCSRDKDAKNTWTLFLLKGALRLDCGGTGSASSFKPEANKVYTIKVAQNKLYVDGDLIYESGSTSFVPGSEIVLMASHKAAASGWDNQARFKLQSCKITDAKGGVIRDYIAAKRSDGTPGLSERANWALAYWFYSSSDTAPKCGGPIDIDFRQRERSVAMATEPVDGRLPRGPLTFAFGDNQRIPGTLYAAFDNTYKGNATNGWAQVVALGPVQTGVDAMTVESLPNPDLYKQVKFFICDPLMRSVSHTRSYRLDVGGLSIFVR